jgi:hypothetical protein
VRSWARFCAEFDLDEACVDGRAEPYQQICRYRIVRYVAYECGVRKVSPDSVSRVYLCAIANGFALIDHSLNFRVAARSERVRFVIRGFMRIYNEINPKVFRSKTPFTLSMVSQAMACLRDKPGFDVWRRAQVRVALRVGI